MKERPRDEEPEGSLEAKATARSEKRESGFPSLGSGAGGVLQAETTGSARVEVGRAG